MSLEVRDFRSKKIKYELEDGDFYLKPLYAVQQVEGGKKIKAIFDFLEERLQKKQSDVKKKKTNSEAESIITLKELINELIDEEATNKLIDLQLDFLNFALEGENKIKREHFRQDVFEQVVSDFFSQLRR